MAEFAEQMQGTAGLAWPTMRSSCGRHDGRSDKQNQRSGQREQQAQQIRAVMALIFPEAVTLVREARSGLQ